LDLVLKAMRNIINGVIILLLFCSCQTHKKVLDNSENNNQQFNNQGEQENYWAEKLFKQDYKK
jgi:hypothetical protein